MISRSRLSSNLARSRALLSTLALAAALSGAAYADDNGYGNPPPPPSDSNEGGMGGVMGGHPHKPPQEAINACKGKSAGDSVSITMPDGKTMTATCTQMGDTLAARPNQMPPRQ